MTSDKKEEIKKSIGTAVKAQKPEELDKLNIYKNADNALDALADLVKKGVLPKAKEAEVKKFIKKALESGSDENFGKVDAMAKLYIKAQNALDAGITFSGSEKGVISKAEVKEAVKKFLKEGSADKLGKLQDIFVTFLLSNHSSKEKKEILDMAIKKNKMDEAHAKASGI